MSKCNNCKEYDYQTHSCPIFCDVIRSTLEDVRADARAKAIDEVLDEVALEKMRLFTAIHEDKGNYEYNIDIAFNGLKNSLRKLKEQK